MELPFRYCDYDRAVINIRQVEGEEERRNASRNRSNRAGTSSSFPSVKLQSPQNALFFPLTDLL
jgi:hypothetical protein